MATDALLPELVALKGRVPGITDIALATRDGILITADTSAVAAESVVAMASAMLGLARQMVARTDLGSMHATVVHGSGGYVATFAVGPSALLVLVGDTSLDAATVTREAQFTVPRLTGLLDAAGPKTP